ncbi:MAG: helix-turn-helix domain-containing protein [bacterium]|nr:helix-turn-helix domain-containing protein [bacterium]
MVDPRPHSHDGLLLALSKGLDAGEQITRLEELVKTLMGLVADVVRTGRVGYSAADISKVLPISERTAAGLIAAGVLPSVYVGRRRMVLAEDLLGVLREMKSIDPDEYMVPGDPDWHSRLAVLFQDRAQRGAA